MERTVDELDVAVWPTELDAEVFLVEKNSRDPFETAAKWDSASQAEADVALELCPSRFVVPDIQKLTRRRFDLDNAFHSLSGGHKVSNRSALNKTSGFVISPFLKATTTLYSSSVK